VKKVRIPINILRFELIRAAKFTALFSVLFLAVSFLISLLLTPLLQAFSAVSAVAVLAVLGIRAEMTPGIFSGAAPLIFSDLFYPFTAVISRICSGDLEIAVLFAAVFSSTDRTLKSRAVGAGLGFFAVLLFNPVRIALTLATGVWFGWEAADFTHNTLFRASLFVFTFVFYAAWYLGWLERYIGWLEKAGFSAKQFLQKARDR